LAVSTTSNREVATSYAKMSGKGLVFEIWMGLADKGADLSILSQYPHEAEICFPPLTALEVRGTRIDGSLTIIETDSRVNSATVEQEFSVDMLAFKEADENSTGVLALEEFSRLARARVPTLTAGALREMFLEIDEDHSGEISFSEYQSRCVPMLREEQERVAKSTKVEELAANRRSVEAEMEVVHQQKVNGLAKAHNEKILAVTVEHKKELAALGESHAISRKSLEAEHEQLTRANEGNIAALEKVHEDDLALLTEAHEEAIKKLNETLKKESSAHKREVQGLAASHKKELNASESEHKRVLAAIAKTREEIAEKVADQFKTALGKEITLKSKAVARVAAEMMVGESNDTSSAYSSSASERKLQKLTRAFEVTGQAGVRSAKDEQREHDEITRIFRKQQEEVLRKQQEEARAGQTAALAGRGVAATSRPATADRASAALKGVRERGERRAAEQQDSLPGTAKRPQTTSASTPRGGGAKAPRSAGTMAPACPSPRGGATAPARPSTSVARREREVRPASARGAAPPSPAPPGRQAVPAPVPPRKQVLG
jgi:hypothetical protein